jgi:aconitate decarboxylase
VWLCWMGKSWHSSLLDSGLNRDDIWSLINQTQCMHNPDFDSLPKADRLCTRVTMTLNDGSQLTATVHQPTGGKTVLSNEVIVEKCRQLTDSIITKERQQRIEEIVLSMEQLNDVTAVIALLAPLSASSLA